MKFRRFLRLFVVLVIAVFLAACGGGGSSQSNTVTTSAAQLSGTFVFSASGSDPADGDFFIAGSFTADGKGNITNGLEDLNLGSGVDSSVPFTGTYNVDPIGNITVFISDGTGTPTFFQFPTPSGTSSVKIVFNGTAGGTLQAQSTTGFSNSGTFAFMLSGEGEGAATGSGSFTTSPAGTFTAGTEKYQDGSYTRSTSALTGILSPAFSNGRGTAVIGNNQFSYYVVSQNQIILAGLEESTLLFGAAMKQ